MALERKIPSSKRKSCKQKVNDDGIKYNLPDDGISACEYVGSQKNGVNVERQLLCTAEVGDKSVGSRRVLEVESITAGT